MLGLVGPVTGWDRKFDLQLPSQCGHWLAWLQHDWVRQKVWSATSFVVWEHVQLSEQICPWNALARSWDVEQPANSSISLHPALSVSVLNIISLGRCDWLVDSVYSFPSLISSWWQIHIIEQSSKMILSLSSADGGMMVGLHDTGPWCYKVTDRDCWHGVSILWLDETVWSATSVSVWQHAQYCLSRSVPEIHQHFAGMLRSQLATS